MHPEGFRLLNSLSRILDQLPFCVMARKEVYYHPLLPVDHPCRWENGVCGDFVKAVKENKVLATYTDNEDHAISLFKTTEKSLIFKNSYDNQKQYKIKMTRKLPLLGHYISFRRVTNSNKPDRISTTLLEMGFSSAVIKEAVGKYGSDFEAALAYCYSTPTLLFTLSTTLSAALQSVKLSNK